MRSISTKTLIPAALTLIIVVSLMAVAQPTAALETTITGPEEVTSQDQIEAVVVVTSTGDPVEAENYALTITPAGGEDSVTVTFDSDGTVVSATPARGAVGAGEIRVNRLLNELVITPEAADDEAGYGYGDEESAVFSVSLPSSAFKHGDYTLQASVNTADETGTAPSNEHGFTIVLPGEGAAESGNAASAQDGASSPSERTRGR